MATLFTLCKQALANPVSQESLFVLESWVRKERRSCTMCKCLATVALIRALMKRHHSANSTHIVVVLLGDLLTLFNISLGILLFLQCNKQPRKTKLLKMI